MSFRPFGYFCRAPLASLVTALTASFPFCCGCGSGELPRTVVNGNVTYQGTPIKEGVILFYPVEGTLGPVSTAPIKAGQYSVTNKEGVPQGKHRVVIEGYNPPPPGSDPDAGLVQYLPQKYNRQSELTADVPSGEDVVVRNFELTR